MERRRRFVPWSDQLEGRQLLTAAPTASAAITSLAVTPRISVSPSQDVLSNVLQTRFNTLTPQDLFVANVSSQRQFRIAQLPGFLKLVNLQRNPIPDDVVQALQNDLQAIRNRLSAPPQAEIQTFMGSLRDTLTLETISPDHARVLSSEFGQILSSSGASPELTSQFQQDMNRLVATNINGPVPGMVTANDYALLTQYVLAVGRRVGTGG